MSRKQMSVRAMAGAPASVGEGRGARLVGIGVFVRRFRWWGTGLRVADHQDAVDVREVGPVFAGPVLLLLGGLEVVDAFDLAVEAAGGHEGEHAGHADAELLLR